MPYLAGPLQSDAGFLLNKRGKKGTQGSLGLDDSLYYVNVAFCRRFLLTAPSRRRVV